jgi:hypothetical protein
MTNPFKESKASLSRAEREKIFAYELRAADSCISKIRISSKDTRFSASQKDATEEN